MRAPEARAVVERAFTKAQLDEFLEYPSFSMRFEALRDVHEAQYLVELGSWFLPENFPQAILKLASR